jgi:predicted ferric reductase
MNRSGTSSGKTGRAPGLIIVLLAVLLLAGGLLLPFYYESFSILYKSGIQKVYLRSGKIIGITVALLVFYQIVLASRLRFLEQVYAAGRLIALHRINGIIIILLVLMHPVLIKASENFISYTFAKKYVPEFIGIGLLLVILSVSVTALFRVFLKISYQKWLLLHRLGVSLAVTILPLHILLVSDTFKFGLPRTGALVIFSLNFLLLVRVWLRRLFT